MKNLKLIFYILISFWFLLTASTLMWWFFLILKAPNLNPKMILVEGITLIGLIIFGGLGLLMYNFKYLRSKEQNQQFLLAFAHDLKTSLASIHIALENQELKMQNQNLNHNLSPNQNFNFKDIKTEILRINTLLENSLLQAKNGKINFYKERIDLNLYFKQMNLNYDIFKYKEFDQEVFFDKRYFDLVIRNILYNSIQHGEATQIDITSKISNTFYDINFKDNGRARQNTKKERQNTGLGLHLIAKILKSQKGHLTYQEHSDNGFVVSLRFQQ